MKKIVLSLLLSLFLATAAFAKVNINTASAEDLQSLKGIGQVKAEAIVKHREEHGNFKSIDDLVAVKGIGAKTVEKLGDEIEVSN